MGVVDQSIPEIAPISALTRRPILVNTTRGALETRRKAKQPFRPLQEAKYRIELQRKTNQK